MCHGGALVLTKVTMIAYKSPKKRSICIGLHKRVGRAGGRRGLKVTSNVKAGFS
jgi:hypothetical protein